MGDEIRSITPLNHQQMIRRQGLTFSRNVPRKLPSSNSEDHSDIDNSYGVPRSNTMPAEGPPDRKYPRRTIEQESIENQPATSETLYPLPSVEIMDYDLTTGFRSKDYLLSLFRTRRISLVYTINLKKAILRLIGSMCVAVPEYREIASEYGIVESVFKSTSTNEAMKGDYVSYFC